MRSGVIRLACRGCGRARLFRSEEVFADDRLTVELHKPCPHCGDEGTLRLNRFNEPHQMLLSAIHTARKATDVSFSGDRSAQAREAFVLYDAALNAGSLISQ